MTLWYIITMVVVIVPIAIGAGAFAVDYMREEFYKYPFYEENE